MPDPDPLIPGGNWWWKLILIVALFALAVVVIQHMGDWGAGPTIRFRRVESPFGL